ncbi:MAG: protein-disulfide reductase DsbD [Betaproteobacteria bacterium]|nr:protein-disulfide reductase DsbD [Betaproteobacteria bacterium]
MKFPSERVIALLLAILPAIVLGPALAAEELLEPDLAFRISAKIVDLETVQVRYQIADGYYMYRTRFHFADAQGSVKLGKARMPDGKITEDEFFGKVETYRGTLVIDLPLKSPVSAAGFTLSVVSQGCADIGVCYTPLTQRVKLFPAGYSDAGPDTSGKSSGLLARLQGGATPSAGEEEFLPVEKAFTVEVRAADAQTLVARLTPADSYYLYRDKIRFSIGPDEKAAIDTVQLPRGEPKQDPNFGETEVFHAPVQAVIRLVRNTPEQIPLVLNVGFQGCSEKGLCYPPVTRQHPIALAALDAAAPSTQSFADTVSKPADGSIQQPAEDRRIARLLGTGNFWLVMASFLGFGLLLSFTPCVLPMIPILSGMIAGQGSKVTRARGFTLSATYVLGMALAYAIAGVLAGLSGTLLSGALQNPWVLGAFAGIFVLLALSMFGFYELQLPSAWRTSATDTSNRLTGGTLVGVFVMGVLSALIVGPCVAAPLAGALLYVSQSRDVLLGGSALFMMALGMGLPLLVIGASAGALLPKAGAWMQAVKNFFGVLLLAAAIWMISPLIPTIAQMLCWSALMIISGIYLHAIDPLPAGAGGLRRLWKGVGVIVLLIGVAMLIGGLSGARDIFQPLSGLRMRAGGGDAQTPFVRVASVAELDHALAQAGKPVMLDFYADWCVSCKEMERLTFRDEEVKKRLGAMLLLQADVTANSADDAALLKRFGLFGPPGIIFFDRNGKEIEGSRVIGYRSAERFLPILIQVAGAR